MATDAVHRLTVAEYFALPGDERTELCYGEVIESLRPSADHQDLLVELAGLLKRWVRVHQLGRVTIDIDMVLSEADAIVPAPDLVYVRADRTEVWRDGRLLAPADLVVEIISPTDRPSRLIRRFADYEKYGVGWYWLIDPFTATTEEFQRIGDRLTPRQDVSFDDWFSPGLFPGLRWKMRPLQQGEVRAAVDGDWIMGV